MGKRLCSIEGCGKGHKAHGWCGAHYYRWRSHGDPLGGRTPVGEPDRYFKEIVLNYNGNECLPWPYADDGKGYGVLWRDGRLEYVHRLSCEEENGPAPTADHEAAHNCGKGHLACCTKRHLEWKTRAGNKADELLHGTRNRGKRNGVAKLTEDEVRSIRAMTGTASRKEIGALFGVSHHAIRSIERGENWGWLNV